jgi:predicted AAA+ superfamily ATPase
MEEQNPWWAGEEDHAYEKWKGYGVKWTPGVINKISFEPPCLHFIVGPRQVGKTTALKICIKRLIEKRDPKSIFYYSCDELSDYRELGEVLDGYLSARAGWGIKSSAIFLDEITFVEDWWRAIKSRIDRGVFRGDALVITGSASLELLKEKERFPGRRGYGKDFYFLPLSFSEYVEKLGKIDVKKSQISDLKGVRKCVEANMLRSGSILELFHKYLKTGGFPVPVREFFEGGKISTESKKLYLDWLKSDWRKAGKSDRYMKEVISYILSARLSPVSWLGMAGETSIGSPHTAQSYVECLEDLLVVKVLNIISPDSKVLYRKNKKIHVVDPFLYHVFSYYSNREALEENVVESVVASHLCRVAETYFWRNKSEADVVSLIGGEQVGFEVKWGVGRWRKPRHLKHAISLTNENLHLFLSSVEWSV